MTISLLISKTYISISGQVLLSLLHAWGLDKDLDKVALSKLGLLKPKVPVSYGLMSKGGVMSLMLPTWKMKQNDNADFFTGKNLLVILNIKIKMLIILFRKFLKNKNFHFMQLWDIGNYLTALQPIIYSR